MPVLSVPDLIITIAYFSIPLQIVISLCQYPRLTQQIAVTKIVVLLVLFALFIFLCGTGHLMRCLGNADSTLFHVVNVITAIVSLATALYLIPLTPSLLDSVEKSLIDVARLTKIIDSMYPESVRGKILMGVKTGLSRRNLKCSDSSSNCTGSILREVNEDGENESGKTMLRRFSDHFNSADQTKRMKKFLQSRRFSLRPDFDVRANVDSGNEEEAPIAETFPAASIMFADIVGFTSWSSSHSPQDVFKLLEDLFWEFDEIAKEMGVFKVATIGDCYLAATGVPDPREDHALVLAQFAEKCRRKTKEIATDLELDLGGDTGNLSMRFGIHSGEITAGVLRGHKSRFELFGDTINTASRMETTGAPNRIHVSKETADLLVEGGKKDWLSAREGLVTAKGKGELKTYWLTVVLPEDELHEIGDGSFVCV